MIQRNCLNPEEYDRTWPQQKLKAIGVKHKLELLDYFESLAEAVQNGVSCYHETEFHWNDKGNEAVADTIVKHLRDNNPGKTLSNE